MGPPESVPSAKWGSSLAREKDFPRNFPIACLELIAIASVG